ncbi:MAG: OsmC family protein [Kiritimatiellae bacterium]|nr:OsmC family protein [Kiritimatiellia bacterium]
MANMIFKSEVEWTGESLQSDARSGTHAIRIDEPEVLGGTNTGQNPVELVLSALGGCLVVLVNTFVPTHNVLIKAVSVQLEGDLDPDGFMGKVQVRPGFSAIRYALKIDSDSALEAIEALIEHAKKACPVKDTLKGVAVNRL